MSAVGYVSAWSGQERSPRSASGPHSVLAESTGGGPSTQATPPPPGDARSLLGLPGHSREGAEKMSLEPLSSKPLTTQ